jgi:hypothetical protein
MARDRSMSEDKRILAVWGRPLPAGYSRWSSKLIAKATDVDLRYVQDFMKTQTDQKAIELAMRKLKDNNFDVTDANIARPNNPVFDLDCMRNGQRQCVVDAKGWVGG